MALRELPAAPEIFTLLLTFLVFLPLVRHLESVLVVVVVHID